MTAQTLVWRISEPLLLTQAALPYSAARSLLHLTLLRLPRIRADGRDCHRQRFGMRPSAVLGQPRSVPTGAAAILGGGRETF